MTQYQEARQMLKKFAKKMKIECKQDKPKFRMYLNDYTDYLCQEFRNNLTEHKINLLHNFCASLHP